MEKVKNLLKMIRHFGAQFINLIVSLILFIFNKIHYLFLLPSIIAKRVNSFLKDSRGIIKQSLTALFICAVGDLCAGMILGKMEFFLTTYPGLMVLIPGAIGMRGNIFGSFGSRLSTHLHIGTLSPKFEKSDILTQNILSSLILTVILSILLAIVAKIICIIFHFECISIFDLVLISFFAGVISSIIMLPISMLISLKSFENGWDPDNVTTPLIAAFGDFFTLPSLIISVLFVSCVASVELLKLVLFILVITIGIIGLVYGFKSENDIKTIVKQSTPILFVCSFLGSFSGGILNGSLTTLLSNQSLLTLVPLFSGESGGLVSILGARLASGLHSGLIDPVLRPKKNTMYNFGVVIALAIVMYPVIAILAETSTRLLGSIGVGYLDIVLISLIAGVLLIIGLIFVVFYISTISFRKGLDPDNIVIPLSTSLADPLSSLMLILIALTILGGAV